MNRSLVMGALSVLVVLLAACSGKKSPDKADDKGPASKSKAEDPKQAFADLLAKCKAGDAAGVWERLTQESQRATRKEDLPGQRLSRMASDLGGYQISASQVLADGKTASLDSDRGPLLLFLEQGTWRWDSGASFPEKQAIGHLKTLNTAQAGFQAGAVVDQDQDGQGEYGFLQELAGTAPARGGPKLKPAYIAESWGRSAAQNGGIAVRNGYCFLVYLPRVNEPRAKAVREAATLPAPVPADANPQETRYIVYAWPMEQGKTGIRAFALLPEGVFGCPNQDGRYSGLAKVPAADAALDKAGRAPANLDAKITGKNAGDGQPWTPVR